MCTAVELPRQLAKVINNLLSEDEIKQDVMVFP